MLHTAILLYQTAGSEGLLRKIGSLHPCQWLAGHCNGKKIVKRVIDRSKRITCRIFVGVSPLVQELYLKYLSRHILRKHPQIAQSMIRIVITPVSIPVFKKYISITVEHMISGATPCGSVEIKHNLIA